MPDFDAVSCVVQPVLCHFILFRPLRTRFATTVLLIMRIVLFRRLITPLLRPTFPPVLFPRRNVQVRHNNATSNFVSLLRTFPTQENRNDNRCKRAVLKNMTNYLYRTRNRTLRTATTTFQFILRTLRNIRPIYVVMIYVSRVSIFKNCRASDLIFPCLVFHLQVSIKVTMRCNKTCTILRRTLSSNEKTEYTTQVRRRLIFAIKYLSFRRCAFDLVFAFADGPIDPAVADRGAESLDDPNAPLPGTSK